MTTTWPEYRLKHLVRPVVDKATSPNSEGPYVGLEAIRSWTGEIDPDKNEETGESLGNRFRGGDVLFGKLRPYLAKASAPDFSGHCSGEALVLRPSSRIDTRFLRYRMVEVGTIDAVNASTYGAKMPRASWDFIGNLRFETPDRETQKAIADFLDRETARIDELIEKKQRFLELTSRRIDALVDEAISDPQVPRIRFENIVRRMQRPVVLSEHNELVRLGLFNRGRGVFKKPAADEEGMGDSNFYFVKTGDLILSGQFAWEGAVALATEDEEGCVVSHRYPVYRGKDGVNTAYLLGLLRSGFGDFLLNEASRGAAGRNRPLNTWRLGKEKIPVPAIALQGVVERALAYERQLKKKTEQSISLLNEARSALITAAVTGQIDVRTWGKQGQSDRRLDQIEAEMFVREVRA